MRAAAPAPTFTSTPFSIIFLLGAELRGLPAMTLRGCTYLKRRFRVESLPVPEISFLWFFSPIGGQSRSKSVRCFFFGECFIFSLCQSFGLFGDLRKKAREVHSSTLRSQNRSSSSWGMAGGGWEGQMAVSGGDFFLILFYLFIFGCAGSSLLRRLFSSCDTQRLLSSCSVQASHWGGLSSWRLWALGCPGSIVVAHGPSCSEVCGILLQGWFLRSHIVEWFKCVCVLGFSFLGLLLPHSAIL